MRMRDNIVLMVDQLVSDPTLNLSVASRNSFMPGGVCVDGTSVDNYSQTIDFGGTTHPIKIVECRICHEEDEDTNMEAPCSCSGSLKYAHRRCVQRWCNVKGDNFCEICYQQFKPGYTVPPVLFQIGRFPMNLGGNWEISRRSLSNAHLLTTISNRRDLVNLEYDGHSTSTARSLLCCCLLAIIFIVFVNFMNTLRLVVRGNKENSLIPLLMICIHAAGIFLSICTVARAVIAIQHQRNHEGLNLARSLSNLVDESSTLQCQPHVICFH